MVTTRKNTKKYFILQYVAYYNPTERERIVITLWRRSVNESSDSIDFGVAIILLVMLISTLPVMGSYLLGEYRKEATRKNLISFSLIFLGLIMIVCSFPTFLFWISTNSTETVELERGWVGHWLMTVGATGFGFLVLGMWLTITEISRARATGLLFSIVTLILGWYTYLLMYQLGGPKELIKTANAMWALGSISSLIFLFEDLFVLASKAIKRLPFVT